MHHNVLQILAQQDHEMFLIGFTIEPYKHGTHENHIADRTRKLRERLAAAAVASASFPRSFVDSRGSPPPSRTMSAGVAPARTRVVKRASGPSAARAVTAAVPSP